MIDNQLQLRIHRNFNLNPNHLQVSLYGISDDNEKSFHPTVVFETKDAQTIIEPIAHIDDDAAVQLMDDLWNAGIRPTHAQHTSETLSAINKHLADMRQIAFQGLGYDKP